MVGTVTKGPAAIDRVVESGRRCGFVVGADEGGDDGGSGGVLGTRGVFEVEEWRDGCSADCGGIVGCLCDVMA